MQMQMLATASKQTSESVKREPQIPPQPHHHPTPHAQMLKPQNTSSNQQQTGANTTSSPSSSASYVPQVEAISPTPEDQKENTNLQEIKDKIIGEICKVEKDYASTQYQLEIMKKKQVTCWIPARKQNSQITLVFTIKDRNRRAQK